MDDEKFTNRHGHTITAVQEAVSTLPEPEYKTIADKPVRRRKRSMARFTGFQWRVIGGIVLAVILVPVLVGEYVHMTYSKNIDDAKGAIGKVFITAVNQQKSTVSSASLAGLGGQLSGIRDGLCPGGFLDNLAQLYPRAQQAYADCAAYRSTITALVDQVNVASGNMLYLESLQPLLEGVSKPLEDQFAVLSAQQENWQTFVDGVKRLSVPLSLDAAHRGLLEKATNVRDQWIALVQATNTENTVAFTSARAKLTESFAAFREQATAFSNVVSTSQESLSKAVTALQ